MTLFCMGLLGRGQASELGIEHQRVIPPSRWYADDHSREHPEVGWVGLTEHMCHLGAYIQVLRGTWVGGSA